MAEHGELDGGPFKYFVGNSKRPSTGEEQAGSTGKRPYIAQRPTERSERRLSFARIEYASTN